MKGSVEMAHGNGGRQAHEIISNIFVNNFGMELPLTDSAMLKLAGSSIAFTTDSYVVDPVFFPGGDIGRLAVCGTVNDLAVSGALPRYLSASFIIEEGFPVEDLRRIVKSMCSAASEAGVKIVTGDTKVVEKGKCDKIFITTSGTGIIDEKHEKTGSASMVKPGDKIMINGPVGSHAIAVLGARKQLGFTSPVVSDCAPLNHLIKKVLDRTGRVRFMRDVTRGGLASVLNELAGMTGRNISLNESSVPVEEPVRGVCEMLGFDPFYLANEGKVVFVIGNGGEEEALEIMKKDPLGREASVIGEILPDNKGIVILNTEAGGKRILDMPSGIQVPRIC